jgi:glycerate dehydrogenase
MMTSAAIKANPRIVFLDAGTVDRGDIDWEPLRKLGELTLYPHTAPSETSSRLAGAEIVISNKVLLNAPRLNEATLLRLVAVSATGTNNVDIETARQRQIGVANVAGYGNQAVAQQVLAFILNWATQMHRWVAEPEKWSQSTTFTRLDYPLFELKGRTLGLIGAGRIGSEVGHMAEALGMKVVAWQREGGSPTALSNGWERLPLRALLETSDIVSLHCPLTPETRHLINRESLSWMKSEAFLVNTGRGDLIDESALADALSRNRLGGAGLDVLSQEPPPADHPLLRLRLPNLLITPHNAWTAQEARQRLMTEVTLNIEAFLQGKARNRVV